jgi:hypothetical protein
MIKKGEIHIKVERLEANYESLKIEYGNEIGKLKKEITELREYLVTKEDSRNDFNYLSVMLKKELLKRERWMDYKNVSDYFHFKSAPEAYRLMDKTTEIFPLDVEIQYIKNGNRRKKVIIAKRKY